MWLASARLPAYRRWAYVRRRGGLGEVHRGIWVPRFVVRVGRRRVIPIASPHHSRGGWGRGNQRIIPRVWSCGRHNEILSRLPEYLGRRKLGDSSLATLLYKCFYKCIPAFLDNLFIYLLFLLPDACASREGQFPSWLKMLYLRHPTIDEIGQKHSGRRVLCYARRSFLLYLIHLQLFGVLCRRCCSRIVSFELDRINGCLG